MRFLFLFFELQVYNAFKNRQNSFRRSNTKLIDYKMSLNSLTTNDIIHSSYIWELGLRLRLIQFFK